MLAFTSVAGDVVFAYLFMLGCFRPKHWREEDKETRSTVPDPLEPAASPSELIREAANAIRNAERGRFLQHVRVREAQSTQHHQRPGENWGDMRCVRGVGAKIVPCLTLGVGGGPDSCCTGTRVVWCDFGPEKTLAVGHWKPNDWMHTHTKG